MSDNNSNQSKRSEFVNELDKLGENLGALLRSMWESEERKSIERELDSGLEKLAGHLNHTIDQLKNDAKVENVKKAAKEAWETARGPQILSDVQQGMLDSLKKLNEEIAKRSHPAQEAKPD
jgi:hypothetical protein